MFLFLFFENFMFFSFFLENTYWTCIYIYTYIYIYIYYHYIHVLKEMLFLRESIVLNWVI